MFAFHMENPGLILSTGNAVLFLITYFIVLTLPTGMPIHNSGANRGQKSVLYIGIEVTDGLKSPCRPWESVWDP